MSTVVATLPRRAGTAIVRKPSTRYALGLVLALSRKNVKIRYKRTTLGIVWAVCQPLMQAVVLTFVFTRVFSGRGANIENFGLYVLSGVMPYSAISTGIQAATGSVVENASLVKKVMLPRLVFPFAAIGSTLTVFAMALGVLVTFATIEGQVGWRTLALLPLVVTGVVLMATSVGILGAALFVQYRDVKFVLESGLLMLFYASPVFYTSELLGDLAPWQRLNPVVGVLSLSRAAVAGRAVDWVAVGWTATFTVVLLTVSVHVFNRRAQLFADHT